MPIGANSQDLVRVKEIRGQTLILDDGTLCQLVLVNGINVALKSAQEQEAIIRSYQNFLNSIDFTIQIVIHSRKINIDRYLKSLDERKDKELSGLLQNQITEYQEFIRSFVQEYAVMRKMFVVIVPYVPINLLPSKATASSLFSLFKSKKPISDKQEKQKGDSAEKNDEEDEAFKEATNQLRQRILQITEGLKTIGLDSTILNEEQTIELLYNFYNPETVEKEHIVFPNNQSPENPVTPGAQSLTTQTPTSPTTQPPSHPSGAILN